MHANSAKVIRLASFSPQTSFPGFKQDRSDLTPDGGAVLRQQA
jgi:hypothetical protein